MLGYADASHLWPFIKRGDVPSRKVGHKRMILYRDLMRHKALHLDPIPEEFTCRANCRTLWVFGRLIVQSQCDDCRARMMEVFDAEL